MSFDTLSKLWNNPNEKFVESSINVYGFSVFVVNLLINFNFILCIVIGAMCVELYKWYNLIGCNFRLVYVPIISSVHLFNFFYFST